MGIVTRMALAAVIGFSMAACRVVNNDSSGVNEVITVETVTINQYDAAGNLANTSEIRYEYDYNSRGNRMESRYYNTAGELDSYEIYAYDANGNRTESRYYNASGDLNSYEIYAYDPQGKRTESRYYDAIGALLSYELYDYDHQGNLTESRYYNAAGELDERQEALDLDDLIKKLTLFPW